MSVKPIITSVPLVENKDKITVSSEVTDAHIRAIVADILGIRADGSWEVTESVGNLVLINHLDVEGVIEYPDIRGMVIDIKNRLVVARSSPLLESVIMDKIEENDGKVSFDDDENYDVKDLEIYPGFESCIFRVFLHAGVVYVSTRKRFDASNSRWGSSETLLNILNKVSGNFNFSSLFKFKAKFSSWCHTFAAVDSQLLVATRYDVGQGCCVYLGSEQLWDPKSTNLAEVDTEFSVPDSFIKEMPKFPTTKPGIYQVPKMTLKEANRFLAYGPSDNKEGKDNHKDQRAGHGEFLFITHKGRSFKVFSSAWDWRNKLRDGQAGISYRMQELMEEGLKCTDIQFLDNFILFTDNKGESSIQPDVSKIPQSKSEKLDLIRLNFHYSLPLSQKEKLAQIKDMPKDEIVRELISLYNKSYALGQDKRKNQNIVKFLREVHKTALSSFNVKVSKSKIQKKVEELINATIQDASDKTRYKYQAGIMHERRTAERAAKEEKKT